MDGAGFDDLTKAFAISRRSVLKRAAAGALGIAAALAGLGVSEALACSGLRRRCSDDSDCCSGACDPGISRCVCPPDTEACDGACRTTNDYASDPDNCGACRVRCRRAPECQSPVCVDGACGGLPDPAQLGHRCGRGSGICLSDGSCGCPPELPTSCRTGCVDSLTDINNCGGCGVRCRGVTNGDAICVGGVCQVTCDAGFTACGATCCPQDECCAPGGVCSRDACDPHCTIEGTVFAAGAINPAQGCQVCDPARSTTTWSPVNDFAVCGGVAGRVCCNGECCSPTECCNPTGFCEECGPLCRIDGRDVDEGETNPANPCQVCDPSRNVTGWSQALDGSICGGGLDDELVCCAGICCGLDQCCRDGACGECGCTIDGRDYDRDQPNPGNACEICDPDRSRTSWTATRSNSPCGLTGGRTCCEGVCCPDGECCNQIGECAPCGCTILGTPYEPGDVNPSNTCQICDPDRDREAWTTVADGGDCGAGDDDRVCCAATCCEQGNCCVDGACQPCGCEIAGVPYDAGVSNPDNSCEVCRPTSARLAWSPVEDDVPCGASGERVCCDGVCCAEGDCCLLGACGTCLCSIENETYAALAPNPSNICERCDPDVDAFDWTPVADQQPCGEDRVCCSGECCDEGECCTLGVCGFCGCDIDGIVYAEGAPNPSNGCQICDPILDRFNWSANADDTFCGDNGNQVCCAGACCPPGHCCSLAGLCEPCRCQIDGVNYQPGEPNPTNGCEVCAPGESTTEWSAQPDDAPCGDERSCCAGTCCEAGSCCTLGVCGPCGCTIDGLDYDTGATLGDCFVCDPVLDQFAWSPVSDGPCTSDADRICCAGHCCELHQCCGLAGNCASCRCLIDGEIYSEGAVNPASPCEVCDPFANPDGWSNAPANAACGTNGVQRCCSGVCCPSGECCHALTGACGAGPCTCEIAQTTVNEGEVNPLNPCQLCDPATDPAGWSPAPDMSTCHEPLGDIRYCCASVCCAAGLCCSDDGRCVACDCEIDGIRYVDGQRNPANDCQVCLPDVSGKNWSLLADDTPCGDNLSEACCNGACGACASCTIDGVSYRAGDLNPANTCQRCDPAVTETAWSVAPDHAKCGYDLDRVCCRGVCCADGDCCRSTNGSCSVEWCGMTDPCTYEDPCGCMIDGVYYPHQTVNPSNDCQWCDAYFSTTGWVSRGDGSSCGPLGDRFCCSEVCCETGACCNTSLVCEFEAPACQGCVIGGRFFRNLQKNPDNPCQICDRSKSTSAWTNAPSGQVCGQMVDEDGIYWGNLYCCEGRCCTDWYSCCLDGACSQGPC